MLVAMVPVSADEVAEQQIPARVEISFRVGDETLMKFSQLFVVVASVVGLVTFLNPDGINDPKFTESMVLLCRIGMAMYLMCRQVISLDLLILS